MKAYIVVRMTYDEGDGVRLTAEIDEAGARYWGDEGVLLQVPVDLGKIVDSYREREAQEAKLRAAAEAKACHEAEVEMARRADRSARAVRGPAALAALEQAEG